MGSIKEDIREHALALGFGEVRFASVEPFDEWREYVDALTDEYRPKGVSRLVHDPKKLMEDATSIVVCLMPFALNKPLPGDVAPFAAYYPASQHAHNLVQELAGYITSLGYEARANPLLPARHAAMRAYGGMYGSNRLFVHEKYGSLCAIRLVLTNACEPDEAPIERAHKCPECGLCVDACPVGVLEHGSFAAEKCLRATMGRGNVPEEERSMVETIIGCEYCTRACPFNSCQEEAMPPEDVLEVFKYENILSGASMEKLGELVGTNYIDEGKVEAITALVAANNGRKDTIPWLQKLAEEGNEKVKRQAKWALELLNVEKQM